MAKKKFIDRIKDAPVEMYDRIVAQTRMRYYPRWLERMAEIGKPTDNPADLDLTDPYIHIEWLLCDLNNLHYAKSKKEKERAKWYAKLTPEETVVFDNEYKDDLLRNSLSAEAKAELKRQKKAERGKKY